MTARFICIHGHFYQPPRENPWLEYIELEDSAHPYHDWNERVTDECYAPNSLSRILDANGRITKIVNNYASISFNFGPTLLSWLEEKRPQIYQKILEADQQSRERFSGHGSAIAQVYNHMIMPLANQRDKTTQVFWGLRDFEHRFGRSAEGMWLAETAVDLESLDILAENGIAFTILAPHQAQQVRKIGTSQWRDVKGAKIDPRRAYRLNLPSGRQITLFFYDGPTARAVAFENLLDKGDVFAERLLKILSRKSAEPQLAHIATDGETYGHHHRFGDMALAYALDYLDAKEEVQLTNYAHFLEKHPPEYEVQIIENTSWSCSHGVERWRGDCGCATGSHPDWHQKWRQPLREAMDWLRDAVSNGFEQRGGQLFKDPWAARNRYIDVILDRSPDGINKFMEETTSHALSPQEKIDAMKLMELQRHAMLMFTSCGWFFDDISRIESIQVLCYAGRTLQLAQDLFGDHLQESFLKRLEAAPSNVAAYENGRRIYEKNVQPAMVDLYTVGAHYAMSLLSETYPDEADIYAFRVEREDLTVQPVGKSRLIVGQAHLTSRITTETARMTFCAIYWGNYNLSGGVRTYQNEAAYAAFVKDVSESFKSGHVAETQQKLEQYFEGRVFSIKALFRDQQRKLLAQILETSVAEAESLNRQIYDHNAALIRYLMDLGVPIPRPLRAAATMTLNAALRDTITGETLDRETLKGLITEAKDIGIEFDAEELRFAVETSLDRWFDRFEEQITDLNALGALLALVEHASAFPFLVNLWRAQNRYYRLQETLSPERRQQIESEQRGWQDQFRRLGETLSVVTS